ncbi:hypothetical protein RhiirA4_420645 [Rhizophagus irregularis]|uniref:Uncharacterized protein n=1 Tax=Rhizophagus irregularis TaxID=588596 RepID=A0A2I1GIJ3_9GLOM|nr:hypothetical protein RhiirA4_420645 [Rhizophagus irregularis]
MKILPKSARETKAEFFGKKGWTLHTILMYTKKSGHQELDIHAYDHWSMDARQDSWFTASSLHAVIESLENKPKWITIISDNGPHYHNADLMMILGNWLEWYQINVKKWIFLEAGEAKTTIDSHHAQITHAIKRQVRLGLDIMEGADIETAIRDIRGTSVAHLELNRTKDQNKRAKNTLPGNSNLFEWTWPGEGSMAGYILGREIPNVGEWTNFSPAQISNLQKKKIEIPEPMSSTHTTPKNEWVIAMPNISGIDPKRLTRERLLFELKKRNINVINTAKRDELVKELELGLANETEMIQDDISENQENQNIIWNSTYEFPLESGWALKSKQKYGKKGGGKRISKRVWKLLEEYFLEGDVDKSKRFTATTMLENLRNKVEERELDEEEIPKLQTIQGWISRYSAQHR